MKEIVERVCNACNYGLCEDFEGCGLRKRIIALQNDRNLLIKIESIVHNSKFTDSQKIFLIQDELEN